MQSRIESIIERSLDIASGMVLALAAQVYLFPLFGIVVTVGTNVQIMLIFTAISFVRGYFWRRHFNERTRRKYYGEEDHFN